MDDDLTCTEVDHTEMTIRGSSRPSTVVGLRHARQMCPHSWRCIAAALCVCACAWVFPAAAHDVTEPSRARLKQVTDRLPEVGHHVPTRDRYALRAAAVDQVAGLLVGVGTSNDHAAIVDGLVSGAVNRGLEAGLERVRAKGQPFLGRVQGGLAYDNADRRMSYDVLAVEPFHGDGTAGHHVLGQVGAHNQSARATANLGLIYRWINPSQEVLLGGNAFYDRSVSTGGQRLGAGWEAASRSIRMFANAYAPLGERWEVTPSNDHRAERPARGFDTGLAYTPARVPTLDVQATGSRWKGRAVDVFGSGHVAVDPTVYTLKAAYSPVPLVSASAERSRVNAGETDTQLRLVFTYRFGVPFAQQLRRANAGERIKISSRALLPVERNSRIAIDTRDRFAAPPALVGPSILRKEVAEGVAYVNSLVVVGGTPGRTFAVSGPDASHFIQQGDEIRLPAQDYATPLDADGDNVYEVTVTVTDTRGRSTWQRQQVVVRPGLSGAEGDGWGRVAADRGASNGTSSG